MFNKKRMFVFIVFLLFLFFMMTFGSTPGGVVRINTREVKFVDGYTKQVISTQTIEVGKDAVMPDAPVHDKCKFSGWYTEDDVRVDDFTNILNDLTVYSGCAANHYTVRFYDTIAKKVIDTQTVKSGEDAEAPDAPTHSGFTFVRWNKDYTNVTTNMRVDTVYSSNSTTSNKAKYKVEYYTIKDNVTKLHSTKTLSAKVGSNVSATIINISGYKFDEGNASNKLIGTVASNGSLVLKVYYVSNTHIVVIDPQCEDVGNNICTQPGEEPPEEPHTHGDKITLKALKRSYTLSYDVKGNPTSVPSKTVTSEVIGYCKNAKTCDNMVNAGEEVVVTEDVTYYAVWSGSLDVEVANGSDYQSATTNFTFRTWLDGSAEIAPGVTLTLSSNKKLTADYTEAVRKYELTINYLYEDGSNAASAYTGSYNNGATYEVDSPDANKAGYVPEIETVSGTMPTDDLTINVVYYPSDKTPYTIHFYLKDLGATTYTEDTDATLNRTGTTDAPVSITIDDSLRNKYPGFKINTSASHLEDIVAGDGSTELYLKYDRENYTVIIDPLCEDTGSDFCTEPGEEPPEVPHEFGDTITLDTLTRSYTLSYDLKDNPATIDSKTVTSSATKYCVDNPNCSDPQTIVNYEIKGDVTFYAYWEGSLDVEVAEGISYSTDTTVYTFRTWLDGSNEVAPKTTLTLDSNKELEADYTPSNRKYTLTIYYVYSNGDTADTTKVLEVENGATYNVASKDIKGYTADQPIVTDTMPTENVEVTVTYTANELEFSCADINKTFSTSDQTVTLDAASNGTGNYTYSVSHTTNYFTIDNNRVFTIKANTPVETYNVSVTANDSVSSATKTVTCKVTISAKTEGVSEGNCKSNLTYTGSAQTLVENGEFVTYSNESQIGADTYTVKATANDNYAFSDGSSSKELTCTIAPKEVSVTWGTTTTFTYNGSEQAPTASVTTGVNGETMEVTRTAEINAGNYTSTASCTAVTGGQAKCSNYTLTNTTKDYTIVADSSVVIPTSALCNSSLTYSGRELTLATAPSDAVYTLSDNTATNAGNHTVTATLNDTTNYKWEDGSTTAKTFTCTIERAEVNIPTCSSQPYNGSEQTLFEAHTSGEYTNSAITGINADSYTGSLTLNSNYKWSDGSTDAKELSCTIDPKVVSVTWGTTTTFTYNGSAQAPTASVTTGVTGEEMTVTRTTETDAGNYTSTASCSSVTGGQELCSNYTLTNTTKDFTIVAASSVVIPTDALCNSPLTYNGSAQILATAPNGALYTLSDTTAVDAGTHTVTATLNDTTNYKWTDGSTTTKTFTCTINRMSIEPPTCSNQTYSGSTQTLFEAHTSGEYTNSAITGIDADSYTGSVTPTDNYMWSDKTTTAKEVTCTIDPKVVPVTWGTTTEFTYNGSEQAPTASVTTGITGEEMTVTRTAKVNAGNYTSTASCTAVTGGQAKCSNYTLTNTTKDYTIVADSSVVIPTSALCNSSLTYSGRELTLATAPSDAVYTLSDNTATNAGNHTVTATLNDTTNYKWEDGSTTTKTFTCTIDRAQISVPTCSAQTYSGSEQTLFESHTSGEYTNDAITGTYADDYTGSLTPTANYKWEDGSTTAKTVTCTINPKPITITANAQTVTYGTDISRELSNVTVATLATGDTLTSITLTASTTNATTAGTITPSAAVIKKGETDVTSSYNITYSDGNLTINTQSVNIPTCSPVTYTGSEQTLFEAHTTGGYTNSVLTGTNADDYEIELVLDSNYHWADNSTSNKTLTCTINKANLTITANDQTTTYGVSISKTTNDVTVATLVGNDKLDSINLTESTLDATTNGTITPSNAVIMNGTTNVTNNYNITYVPGNLTINTQSIDVPNCPEVTYNGSEQTLFAAHTSGGYTNSVLTGTNANDYDVVLTLDSNYHWSDNSTGNKTITCKINKKPITITAKGQEITYGETISKTTNDVTVATLVGDDKLDSITLTASTTNATEAGTITPSAAVIKKGTTDVTNNYNITYAPGTLVINNITTGVSEGSCNSNLVYTGSPITLAGNGTPVTYSNNSQTNAGTYTVTATADQNYAFSDGSKTKTLTCTIERQGIEVPTCDSVAYNGNEQTLFEAHTTGQYTNSALVQTEVGNYDVELTLTDNYKWNDNSTNSKTVSCIINPIIIFNSNTGSGNMNNQTATYNTATTINENTFTKTGNDFAGWNTSADGTGTPYEDKASVTLTNNLTLYAQWTLKKYTVKWNKVIGSTTTTLETDSDVTYGSAPHYDGATPTYSVAKPNSNYTYTYSFIGWIDQDGNYLTDSTTITKNTTYTAQLVVLKAEWKANMQDSFTRGDTTEDIKDRITVTLVDSTGNVLKTLSNNEYTTNFSNSTLKTDENLVINYTYKGVVLTNTELYYSVVIKAYPTKFEVNMSVSNSIVQSDSDCYGTASNESTYCNIAPGTNGATTYSKDYNFLAITEHYMQTVEIKQVTVTYTNNKTVRLRYNDTVINWSYKIKKGTRVTRYDPTYVADLNAYNLVDRYVRGDGKVNKGDTFPEGAYKYNDGTTYIGGTTCNTNGGCSYNTYTLANSDRTYITYYKKTTNGFESVGTISGAYTDVEGVGREIKYVTISYWRDANNAAGEPEGYYKVTFEYVNGQFIAIDETSISSANLSYDYSYNSNYYTINGTTESKAQRMMFPSLSEEINEELETVEEDLEDDENLKSDGEEENSNENEESKETSLTEVKEENDASNVKENENTEESKEEEKPSSLEETVVDSNKEVEEENKTETSISEVEELPKEIAPIGEVVEEKTIEKEKEETTPEDKKEENNTPKEEEKAAKIEEKQEEKESKQEEKEEKKEVKNEEKTQKAVEETIPAKKEEEEVSEE